jgi:hypothetical protein
MVATRGKSFRTLSAELPFARGEVTRYCTSALAEMALTRSAAFDAITIPFGERL